FMEPFAVADHRRNDRQPIFDFRRTDAEISFGQSPKSVFVATFHRAKNGLIEFLITNKVRQASRSDQCDAFVALPVSDCRAEGATERETTADRRAIRLVMHVEDDGNAGWRRIAEHAVVYKSISVRNPKTRGFFRETGRLR